MITTDLSRRTYFFILLLILVGHVVLRWPYLSLPLERDEGEYAYMGQLLLAGVALFEGAVNMKLPGTSGMYALLMLIFGQSDVGIHLGLTFLSCGTMLFIFGWVRNLLSPVGGLLAAGLYGILAASPSVLGFAAHATHFVVFFVTAGLYCISLVQIRAKPVWLLCTGFLFGMSFLMKQQAVPFLILGGCLLLTDEFSAAQVRLSSVVRHVFFYVIGGLLPYCLVVCWVYVTGQFAAFWFWTVEYAFQYTNGGDALSRLKGFSLSYTGLYADLPVLSWLAAGGFFRLVFSRFYTTSVKIKLVLVVLFGVLSVMPGFYFRPHYFITLLPAFCLLIAILFDRFNVRLPVTYRTRYARLAPLLVVVLTGIYVLTDAPIYRLTSSQFSRLIYGKNPFPETKLISDYIARRTLPAETIAVLGSEPQLYFYANRRGASRHVYVYGLMEAQPFNLFMQQQLIREIEQAKPTYIIPVSIKDSWCRQPETPGLIFSWMETYLPAHYRLEAVVELTPDGHRLLKNDSAVAYQQAHSFLQQSTFYIPIWRRR